MANIQSRKSNRKALLTPPMSELKTALKKSARLQRRLALAYGIRIKKSVPR
jgi:hypothetical protein